MTILSAAIDLSLSDYISIAALLLGGGVFARFVLFISWTSNMELRVTKVEEDVAPIPELDRRVIKLEENIKHLSKEDSDRHP